jgi:hypothetical protein
MARRGTWSRHRLCLGFFIVKTGGRVWLWGRELNDGFWAYWVEIRIAFLVLLSQGCLPSVQPETSQKFRGEENMRKNVQDARKFSILRSRYE